VCEAESHVIETQLEQDGKVGDAAPLREYFARQWVVGHQVVDDAKTVEFNDAAIKAL